MAAIATGTRGRSTLPYIPEIKFLQLGIRVSPGKVVFPGRCSSASAELITPGLVRDESAARSPSFMGAGATGSLSHQPLHTLLSLACKLAS